MNIKCEWRLIHIGALVWAPTGNGWTPGVVIGLGKQREDRTVVHLELLRTRKGHTYRRNGTRYVSQLFWRKGKDKPQSVTKQLVSS